MSPFTRCAPVRPTAVHQTDALAELVCSNSFRADKIDNAVGLIKEEMRRLGSLVMRAADTARVPAGAALAVDRHVFSQSGDRGGAVASAHPHLARRSHRGARPRVVAGDYRDRSADVGRAVAEHPADGGRGAPCRSTTRSARSCSPNRSTCRKCSAPRDGGATSGAPRRGEALDAIGRGRLSELPDDEGGVRRLLCRARCAPNRRPCTISTRRSSSRAACRSR